MALFPKCTFQFLLKSGGALVAGERNEGTLVLDVPEHIPRAEHLFLNLHTEAWASFDSDTVERRELLRVPLQVDLPKEGMPPGRHSYPFTIDLPAWLPPAFDGKNCAVEHELRATLDVNWAIDPDTKVRPVVRRPPVCAERHTSIVRSPPGFHDKLVLESTVASVVADDEPIDGQIAVRAGAEASFDAIVVTLATVACITMGRVDTRRSNVASVVIPAVAARSGEPIPFRFEPTGDTATSFTSDCIDVDYALYVSADIPWGFNPEFSLPVHVVPRGSTIEGGSEVALGSERLRRVAAHVASRTGLAQGRPPVLVYGREGLVSFTLSDAPRGGALAVEGMFSFPALGFEIGLHPLGILEGSHASPLLPTALADRYVLRCVTPRHRYAEAPLGLAAFHRILADLGESTSVHMSDHHLQFDLVVDDDAEGLVTLASFMAAKAKTITEILAALPFPSALLAARPAWEATAREQGGLLVPSVPAIVGVTLGVRTLSGEEQVFCMDLSTDWTEPAPTACLDLSLGPHSLDACQLADAKRMLSGRQAHPLLTPLWHTFSQITIEGPSLVRARTRAPFAPIASDPRAVFAAGEGLVAWLLDVRGERSVDAPYR
jgi:hypothetical protein